MSYKRENLLFMIVLAVLVVIGMAIGWTIRHRSEQKPDIRREYVDSLFRQSRQTVTFDSIRSAVETIFLDSIRAIRSDLKNERLARRREIQNIRRETISIRHRIDSIGPIIRPDY